MRIQKIGISLFAFFVVVFSIAVLSGLVLVFVHPIWRSVMPSDQIKATNPKQNQIAIDMKKGNCSELYDFKIIQSPKAYRITTTANAIGLQLHIQDECSPITMLQLKPSSVYEIYFSDFNGKRTFFSDNLMVHISEFNNNKWHNLVFPLNHGFRGAVTARESPFHQIHPEKNAHIEHDNLQGHWSSVLWIDKSKE
jgi:hypothetical protein